MTLLTGMGHSEAQMILIKRHTVGIDFKEFSFGRQNVENLENMVTLLVIVETGCQKTN